MFELREFRYDIFYICKYVYTQNSILHKWGYDTYLLVHVIIKSCNFYSPALQKVSVYVKETFIQHCICLTFLYATSLSSQYINKGCFLASSPSSWLNYYTIFSLLDADLQRTGCLAILAVRYRMEAWCKNTCASEKHKPHQHKSLHQQGP